MSLFESARQLLSASALRGGRTIIIGLLGSLAILGFRSSRAQFLIATVLIWAIMGISWNIISGYGGQVSFGHAIFFGIGAFVPTLMMRAWNVTPIVGGIAGCAVAAVAAALIGWPTFRLRGIYFGLATLAYPLILIPIFSYFGYQEVSIPFVRDNPALYLQFRNPIFLSFVALGALVSSAVAVEWLESSKFGIALQAIRGDQEAAEAAGINSFRTKMEAFILSAVLGSVAGTLYAVTILVITPQGVFGLTPTVRAIIVPLVGGIASFWGPVIGSVLLIPLDDFLISTFGSTFPGINGVVFGGVLVAMVLIAPDGIYWNVRRVLRRKNRTVFPVADVKAEGTSADGLDAEPSIRSEFAVGDCFSKGKDPGPGDDGTRGRERVAALEVAHLTKSYSGLRALQDVTFEVFRGDLVGIIGPNGAGKTTLFNILSGFLGPDSGSVAFFGKDYTRHNPWDIAQAGVGRTFQVPRLMNQVTVLDNVAVSTLTHASSRDEAHDMAAAALRRVDLHGRAHSDVASLSTEEVRRLELARAIAGHSQVLILDEPLAGLSGGEVSGFLATVDELRSGRTVIMIDHTMSAMAGFVEGFIVLNQGKVIAEGDPEMVLNDPHVIESYLGDDWR